MDSDVFDQLTSPWPWSLSRVTGRDLDPGKHCYVVTKNLCGTRPNAFAKNKIFCRFSDEICSVLPADLKPAVVHSTPDNRTTCMLYPRSVFVPDCLDNENFLLKVF